MNRGVEPCIQKVEQLLRGGGAAGSVATELRKEAVELLSWYSSTAAIDEFEDSSDSTKSEMLALAVKLHNKARNLTSQAHGTIRTCLKATAAWMLSIYGGDKSKVLSAVTSILSKSGEELASMDEFAEPALKCLSGTILYWNRASALSLHTALSPVELQDMKLSVFWASLEKAKLLWSRTGAVDEVRKTISVAAELMQTLPSRTKLSFAERVATIAKDMAQKSDHVQDSIHMFKMALNGVDSALLPVVHVVSEAEGDGVEGRQVPPVEARILRLNVQLSLAFLYMQAK